MIRYIYLLIFLTPLLSQEEIAPTLHGEELFDYIQDNYKDSSEHIQNFKYYGHEDSMQLDSFTIKRK